MNVMTARLPSMLTSPPEGGHAGFLSFTGRDEAGNYARHGLTDANPMNPKGLIDRRDSLLIVLDTQDGFLRNLTSERQTAVSECIRFLVQVARRVDVPTFVTVESPAECGPTTQVVRGCLDAASIDHDKHVFGLCDQENLREIVLAQSRRTAILVGLETDVCVLHSAVSLLREGFRTVIVSDAAASPGENHERGLARAAWFGAEIVNAKGLYYEWARSLEGLKALTAEPQIAVPSGIRL